MFGYVLLALLPLVISKNIAIRLADMWRFIDKKHRVLAIGQSMDRLGIDEKSARLLVKRNYRHYALFIMEVARLKNMPLEEVARRTDINGCDRIMTDVLAEGKGMVVVTGHLGNWEWGAVVLGMLGVVDGLIARPLDNPFIDSFIKEVRERTGALVWDKAGSMRKALAAVQNGKGFVAVIDQNGGSKGCRVPFLDKESSTMTAPVDLAIRTGAPLFVGAVIRTNAVGKFTMIPKRVHRPIPGNDLNEERKRLTSAINADLSEIIRAYPEQWIWIHSRWKLNEQPTMLG